MTDYKLVPAEPTPEMIRAGKHTIKGAETTFESILAEVAYKSMLAAAPAVQVEPIGWYTEDHFDDKSATTYSAEVAQRWRDKGWPVWPLYTTPQPAEQQPELAKYQPCGCVICTCEHETQCQGCGGHHCGAHPVGQIPNPAYQQVDRQALAKIRASRAADDLHARNRLLADALEQILGWRELRSGREFPIERIEDIALAALATYRKGGDK